MICFISPVIEAPEVLPGATVRLNLNKMLVVLISILDNASSRRHSDLHCVSGQSSIWMNVSGGISS